MRRVNAKERKIQEAKKTILTLEWDISLMFDSGKKAEMEKLLKKYKAGLKRLLR